MRVIKPDQHFFQEHFDPSVFFFLHSHTVADKAPLPKTRNAKCNKNGIAFHLPTKKLSKTSQHIMLCKTMLQKHCCSQMNGACTLFCPLTSVTFNPTSTPSRLRLWMCLSMTDMLSLLTMQK